jgi:hypothetical protein
MRKTRVARGRRVAGRRRTQRGGEFRYGTSPGEYRHQGEQDLHTIATAAVHGDLQAIRNVISKKSTRSYKDEVRAGLWPAAAHGHLSIAEYLLKLPGVSMKNRNGNPYSDFVDEKPVPLYTAAPRIVHGDKVYQKVYTSPLEIAKQNRHTHVAIFLQKYSAEQGGGGRRRRTRRKHQRRRA